MTARIYVGGIRRTYTHRGLSNVTTLVVDTHAPDACFDSGDDLRWATICETHGGVCSHWTLADAIAHAPDPDLWCPYCQTARDDLSRQLDKMDKGEQP